MPATNMHHYRASRAARTARFAWARLKLVRANIDRAIAVDPARDMQSLHEQEAASIRLLTKQVRSAVEARAAARHPGRAAP